MTKKLAIILIVIGLLLPGSLSAQGDTLGVWNALSREDSEVLSRAADRFGAAVELRYVDPPYLLDSALSSGTGPDVIITSKRTADALLESKLITPVGSQDFFLSDLLNALPSLVEQHCGDQSIEDCFWPGGSFPQPLTVPDRSSVDHTREWLCVSSDWLPWCSGSALPGVPLSWSFSILLFDTGWLAKNGLDLPTTQDNVTEIRSQYGLSLVQAEQGFVPTAGDLSPDTIYQVDSTLLSEDPDGMIASLISFYQAGYAAVIIVGIDSAYVGAAAPNPDLARQFASFLGSDLEVKAGLLDSAQRLPAFASVDLSGWGLDSREAKITLQALTLLVAYAGLTY